MPIQPTAPSTTLTNPLTTSAASPADIPPHVEVAHERPVAVVTGASSGIGYELARQFAAHGFDLIITAKGADLDEARDSLDDDFDVEVEAVRVDLRDYDGVESLYAAIRRAGAIDSVAINAGVGVGGDFVRETDLERELDLIDLNVKSTVHLAKRVLADMVTRGHGRVLFTSSIAATMPGPLDAVYSASKAFVQSFAEAVRDELRDTGVTVTALQPGATATNFFRRADMANTRVGRAEKDDPADVAKDGFDALMAGRDHVVAGSFKNNLMAAANKLTPEAIKAKMHRKQNEPADDDDGDRDK